MKKLILFLVSITLLVGCSLSNSPTKKTEEFLTNYQSLSDEVMTDLDLSAEAENIASTHTQTYKDVMTRQYQNLKYEITNEEVNGDEAVVTAKVTVYDLHKAMKESQDYMTENLTEFEENGTYNQNKFMEYQLDKMLKTEYTIDYSIDFYLTRVDDVWQMQELSNITKEKLHGTYDYEVQ